IEQGASWDRDNITWGGRGEGFGTVPVIAGIEQGASWDRDNITWGGRGEGFGTVPVIAEGATMTIAFSLKLEVCSRVPRTCMDEAIQADAIRILKGSFVLYVGEPPEKIVTCGSHPLEPSFHTVLGRGHMGSHIYGFIAVVNYEVTVTIQKVFTAYAFKMVENVISHPLTQFVIEGEISYNKTIISAAFETI
nr:hypothetical protein [Tanacetum cinerariifolium]